MIARELRAVGLRVQEASLRESIAFDPAPGTLVIDALFGTGLSRPLPADALAFIDICGRRRLEVIAVDGPSGLDFDRGNSRGGVFNAKRTYTFGLAKPGFFLNEGPGCCGRVRVLDIGFPKDIVHEEAKSVFLFTRRQAVRLLPVRSATGNKARFGRVLIIAGREGMEGAGILCASAASRSGAGYVTWAPRERVALDEAPPDFLKRTWERLLKEGFRDFDAIAVGPALGIDTPAARLLERLRRQGAPAVVDADALSWLARTRKKSCPSHWILTPHARELGRLLDEKASVIEGDRQVSARRASLLTGAIVLLKGFHTMVDDGRVSFIVHSGNSALAKAGSGDVLTGLIAGLRAQGLEPLRAALLGAWIHGACADLWVKKGRTQRTLMASDLPALLGEVFRGLEEHRPH